MVVLVSFNVLKRMFLLQDLQYGIHTSVIHNIICTSSFLDVQKLLYFYYAVFTVFDTIRK